MVLNNQKLKTQKIKQMLRKKILVLVKLRESKMNLQLSTKLNPINKFKIKMFIMANLII